MDKPGKDSKKTIADRYELIKEIGSGGVSTVYKAQDLVLKRILAVKVLQPRKMREDYLVRLQREAKAICQLNHPGIIDVYDFQLTEDNEPFLAMEYVDGISLQELVKQSGPLKEEDALPIFGKICDALSFAHSRKILHRDLKPGNVLVSGLEDSCDVKIIDFGIAKSLDVEDASMTTSGNVVGTPSYMSPEQARGETLDERSDVYALGCLMYKVLTGESPFKGDSFNEVIDNQVHQKAPSLEQGNSNLSFSIDLEKLVEKALAKQPKERYQSMNEMKAAIEIMSASANRLAIDVPEFKKGSGAVFFKYLVFSLIVLLIAVPIIFGVRFIAEKDFREVENEATAKAFAIRKKFDIGHKYVKERHWLTLRGKVDRARLSALKQLDVLRLDISNSEIDNEALDEISSLPLVILDARNSNLSDQGLETISSMKTIRSLIVGNCPKLTSEGYQSISKLKDLEILDLRDSTVSDANLKVLSGLKKMIVIYVSNSPNIKDGCIDQFLSMKSLLSIRLGGTAVSKEAINKLKEHPSLIFIGLKGSNLSYENMPEFAQSITMLDLSNSNLEDRCLSRVYNLKKLWYLDVRNCPKISMTQHRKLLKIYDIQLGKALLSAYTPELPDIEWYLDPESYSTKLGDKVDLRKKLIRSAIHGDPEL